MSTVSDVDVRSPWHRGEIALQKKTGVFERMSEMGQRVVRHVYAGAASAILCATAVHRRRFGR